MVYFPIEILESRGNAMDPIFTEEQLNRMSREDMLSLLKVMQGHRQKQEETLQKQETRIRILEERTKELRSEEHTSELQSPA